MHAVSFNKVYFRYSGMREFALADVSVDIEEGEFILVTGHSGSGKSTFCRLINGLIPNFYEGELTGKVYVFGEDTKKLRVFQLAKKVGMVFQNPDNQLVSLNVEREIAFGPENLGLTRVEIRSRVNEVIHRLGIEYLKEKLNSELSGGEKQKVILAAVLAMRPSILVLDEPTSELDPLSALRFLDFLDSLRSEFNVTVILVEQRVDYVVRLVDRVLVFSNGRIIADDLPRKVFSKTSVLNSGAAIPKPAEFYESLLKHGFKPKYVPLDVDEAFKLLEGLNDSV